MGVSINTPSQLRLREHCKKGVRNNESEGGEEYCEVLPAGWDMAFTIPNSEQHTLPAQH